MTLLSRFKPELQGIIQKSFKKFTPIQEQAMPSILDGKNTLVIAPTGSGKTEAAFLPVINGLIGNDKKGIIALYIAPLRSLNRDMLRRMEEWCAALGCSVEVRHGDTTIAQRSRQRLKPPQLLITTPETLQAILPAKVMRKHLASVEYVIIDEIHELVSDKRGIQLALGLERLRGACGKFQTIGLSATVGTPEMVASYYKLDEIIIDKSFKGLELTVERPKNVVQRISEMTGDRSTLIFTNTRVATEMLTRQLRAVKDVGIHHSSLSKEERIETERQFKEGEIKTLICTSSMELGIDVGEIEQVIQLSSPRQVARLIQRVGRSGHSLQRVSKGTVLATDFDDLLEASIIADRALKAAIEETECYEGSLDVLAHQTVGLTLDYGDIRITDAYAALKKAYPYRNLTAETFDAVIEVLKRLRLIGWNDTEISRKRNSLFYYYANLSTIPTYNRYLVINLASHKPVGVLDEEYIIDCQVNSMFILKGEAWRIVDFRGDRVMVIPVSEIGVETPVWVGEDLPVPYEIAREAGVIRRRISEGLDRKKTKKQIVQELSLPLSDMGMDLIIETISKQKKQGEVPTDRLVTIERFIENFHNIVINTCFGTKANDTIARVIASLLSAKYGEGVGVKVDPYRIVLTGMVLEEKDVVDAIESLNPDSLREILEKTITRTNLFRFAFAHVGKRFGVFKSDVKFREINMARVIDAYRGTPVYQESLDEVFKKYFDLENARRALKLIRSGDIELDIQSFTVMSQPGIEQFKDAIQAETPERAIIETVKNRLKTRKLGFVCLHCGEALRNRTVDTVAFPVKCPKCDSWMMAPMNKYEDELSTLVKKKKRGGVLDKQETLYMKSAHKAASLVHSYEQKALLAMNARGVGPRTAARILDLNLTEDDFYKEILNAEREFVRTSKFWRK